MRAVLAQEQTNEVPPDILAKKYYRINMASGSSTEEVRLPNGSVEEGPVCTFGAVLHYAAVFTDGRVMAFAVVERAKSTKDRRGRFGYSGTK